MGKALGITLEEARKIIAAATKKANEINVMMNIAVVDAGGNLVAFERMDGGWIGSIDIAQKKAFTARAFDLDTKSLGENSQSGQQFFGIHASNNGKIMIFAGGIPIKRGGEVVGAIGVSGGSGKDDHSVAEAGVAAATLSVGHVEKSLARKSCVQERRTAGPSATLPGSPGQVAPEFPTLPLSAEGVTQPEAHHPRSAEGGQRRFAHDDCPIK